MEISPLALGLITGASEIEDPHVEQALVSMLSSAGKDDLVQALMDMTGLVVALSNHSDFQIAELVAVVT